MKLWIIPVVVAMMVGLVAAAYAVLPPSWAFLTIATCVVVCLGAAPVVFAVHTRRVEIRQREPDRSPREEDWL